MDINVKITEHENMALNYVVEGTTKWVEDFVKQRAKNAANEIVDITVKHCLDNGIQVPPTREDIVEYAFANGVVKTAAERQAEAEAAMEKL